MELALLIGIIALLLVQGGLVVYIAIKIGRF